MKQLFKTISLLLVISTLILVCGGCGPDHGESDPTVTTQMPDVVFNTAYCEMAIPEEYAQCVIHREDVDGEITMEIFSMPMDDNERELFRVCFGDPDTGNLIGSLSADGREVPVTLSVIQYDTDAFTDEITAEKYYKAMEALDYVLASIRTDSRFVEKDSVVVEKEDEQVGAWTFPLPQNVQWEQTETEDGYRLDFYGIVNGEKYPLYAVAFGRETLETVLGVITADGTALSVSVESCELPDTQDWSNSDELELYTMMESINDVIQVIRSDKSFSEELSEE